MWKDNLDGSFNIITSTYDPDASAAEAEAQAGIATTQAGLASGYATQSAGYRDESEDFKDEAEAAAAIIKDYAVGYIGQFSYGARLDVPEGQLRCDGSSYTKSQFPTFFTSYLVGGKIPTVSYATYASEISANGVCGSFALDEVGETFKTPTLTGSTFIAQALISGDIAKFVSAGLPNITGKIDKAITGSAQNEIGALKRGVVTGNLMSSGSYANYDLEFDASGSSAIYGKSDTVTPAHIKYPLFVCVANVQIPTSEAQYQGFIDGLTDLANKADKDLSNVDANIDYVVESYSSGTEWYRKYKSGWIEQGGKATLPDNWTITFLVPFTNTNYSVNGEFIGADVTGNLGITGLTTTSMSGNIYGVDGGTCCWIAYGY